MRFLRQSLLLCAAALLTSLTGQAEIKVLQNFTLIDGTGKEPVRDAAIVINNGRIQYAGPKSKMKAPQGAEMIDLSGKFVMPGIINLHGHLGNVVGLKQDPSNFTRENLEKDLKKYASYGVTSVVSMGSDQDVVFQARAEQRSGRPRMTRIFTAYRGFTSKAGYPTMAAGMKGVPYEVETPAQVKKAVAELADRRVDLVKIWVDDHLGRDAKISIDLSKAIIDEAHKNNLKVTAHIFYLQDAKMLVDAGLDGLVHSVRDKPVDDELIASMKKHGAWQAAATLARELSTFVFAQPPEWLDDPFFTRSVSRDVIKTLKSSEYQKRIRSDEHFKEYPGFLETAKKNLKRLVDAGVKYGFGTDSGPPARFQGYFEHLEMELMKDAGLTPMQIITAATRNSAEFLEQKDLGTLEKGKWADLIVLEESPLENIRNTRSIEMVMIAGNKVN